MGLIYFRFLACVDWDLAVCLQYECRRKQLRKPMELNSWIDLRATYRVSFECYHFVVLKM
jgi:ERI1 exoribonuclease 2